MTNAMFKKFSMEVVQSQNKSKSSVQRAVRTQLAEQFPSMEVTRVVMLEASVVSADSNRHELPTSCHVFLALKVVN